MAVRMLTLKKLDSGLQWPTLGLDQGVYPNIPSIPNTLWHTQIYQAINFGFVGLNHTEIMEACTN